jgi:Protein of unknown function (DUF2817)
MLKDLCSPYRRQFCTPPSTFEGFAGSAIQLQMLKDLPIMPKDAALIVVHALNPYGMAHLRRVNENNVDPRVRLISCVRPYNSPPRPTVHLT